MVYNVCIQGPPGVGKLTVARELAKLTGFKLPGNTLLPADQAARRIVAHFRLPPA